MGRYGIDSEKVEKDNKANEIGDDIFYEIGILDNRSINSKYSGDYINGLIVGLGEREG